VSICYDVSVNMTQTFDNIVEIVNLQHSWSIMIFVTAETKFWKKSLQELSSDIKVK
jgi:hypothetical protein